MIFYVTMDASVAGGLLVTRPEDLPASNFIAQIYVKHNYRVVRDPGLHFGLPPIYWTDNHITITPTESSSMWPNAVLFSPLSASMSENISKVARVGTQSIWEFVAADLPWVPNAYAIAVRCFIAASIICIITGLCVRFFRRAAQSSTLCTRCDYPLHSDMSVCPECGKLTGARSKKPQTTP
jgi:hypothetical protein